MKLLKKIVKKGLCTGCGTCVAICPENALEIQIKKGLNIPFYDKYLCKNCDICFKVCPGYDVDFKILNKKIFGKDPEDMLLGNFIECYTGFTKNDEIRFKSSSGGLLSQFLIYALDENIIDAVIVTKMDEKNPLISRPVIAREKKDILKAAGSKYIPVSLNILIEEILRSDEKYAFVGLPCHMHGVRKAESLYKNLKNKIPLHLGLFCAGTKSYLGTEFILKKNNISPKNVKRISYRGNGWPGSLKIEFHKQKNNLYLPMKEYYDANFCAFTPWRCTLCSDHTCELADISFGDAWLPEYKSDKLGRSIVITRNSYSHKLLENLFIEKKIKLDKINPINVLKSQGNLKNKKFNINARINISKIIFKEVPKLNNYKYIKPSFKVYINAILFYFQIALASNKRLWWILEILTELYKKFSKNH